MRRLRSLLALGVAAGVLSCSQPPGACEFEVTFDSSRDGGTDVYTLALGSLAVRRITDFPELNLANRFPDWSPDGREIVFVSEDSSGVGDLFIVAADASDLRKLTSDPARYENPAWAPAGGWIAFEKGRADDWGLYVIRPDGRDLHRVQGKNLFHPSWSPDGERLAVVTGNESDYYGAILSLEDGRLQRFTPAGVGVGSVKWSPDGTAIAFDAVVENNFDLYVVDPDGSNLRRLTKSPAIDARPEWSPDGSKVLFHSTRDFGSVDGDVQWKRFEIYLLDLKTGKVGRLTHNESFDAHPDFCKAAD